MSRPPETRSYAPAPLDAFLRQVERPAAVFTELMGVSWLAGDASVAAAMRSLAAMAPLAAELPEAEWPHRFWHLLLDAPALRRATVRGPVDDVLAPVLQHERGLRSAVLLALLGELPDADAAAALGVAPATFQRALRLGLPRRHGQVDPAQWRAWQEATQARVAALPSERIAQLDRSRAAALTTGGMPVPPPEPDQPAPRGVRAPLAVGLAMLLALAATFVDRESPGPLQDPEIGLTALPPAAKPASRFDPATALLTHPDFERATDPAAAQSGDLELHAWYAARLAAQAPAEAALPLSVQDAAAAIPAEAADAL
ncbi:MAG TPA: hypothetical protein VNI56_00880 [Xanthomonadaceae bacterium]|nr:hypothetical protein [Xanthomonadaceae bacterium]